MDAPKPSKVSKGAFVLMLVIVIALVLLSLYANVQHWRRDQVETTIFIPAQSSLSVSPSPSPR